MKTYKTLVVVAVMAALPFAAHAATTPTQAVSTAQRAAGSVDQTTPATLLRSVQQPGVVTSEPEDVDSVTAVCISNSPAACGAQAVASTATAEGCAEQAQFNADEGSMDEPSSWCHGKSGPTYTHQPHVAYCDVEDVGLQGCLAKYAPALVKHGPRARLTFTVTMQDAQGRTREQTVLLPITGTAKEAAQFALAGTQGETVVAVN